MESNYKIETLTYEELEKKAVVPSFQRKLTWSKSEKRSFIETLHYGYPFGAILIYKYEDESKFSLVDGLQRYTTIRDYQLCPEKYVDFSEVIADIYSIVVKEELSEASQGHLLNQFEDALKQYVSYITKKDYKLNEFLDTLSANSPEYRMRIEKEEVRSLSDVHDKFREVMESYLEISKVKIPTIVFTGEVSELATVFENLNRGGRKLSKYQVFAAQWNKHRLRLQDTTRNEEILNITINRYKQLTTSREIEIENFNEEEMLENREINMSELCYAIGKKILEEMKVFWNSENEDLANQIGFSTLAIVFGISNKKLNTLIDKFEVIKDAEFLEELIEKVLGVYRDINICFKKPFRIPGDLKDTYFGGSVGTDFQILSFFAYLWNIKYGVISETRLTIRPRYKHKYEKTEENLLRYFILDAVSGKWSGSGDSKLDNIVLHPDNTLYSSELPKEKLENQLFRWHEEIIKKQSINFEKVSGMLYTVLCSFYSSRMTEKSYDKEHVIPKYFLNKIKGVNIPGGSIGNLMYLDINNNRAKQTLTLYEQLKPGQSLDSDYFGFQCYPTENTFGTIKQEIEMGSNDYSNVLSTIKNRGHNILTDLMNKLYK